jgi:FkbM family methyltransferase
VKLGGTAGGGGATGASRQTTGRWLFDHGLTSWLHAPELNRQLPPHLKLFARYCSYQRKLKRDGPIYGGLPIFRLLTRVSRLLDPRDIALLAHGFTVHLKSTDPRLLQVPNELSPLNPNRRALERLLSAGDTFIDVGANHGTFSLVACRALGESGMLIAIEPQAELARLIGLSLAKNAACAYFIHQLACGDSAASAPFYVPRGSSGSAGLFDSHSARDDHDVTSVSVRTLDSLVDAPSLPGNILIKLDVEGNESAVLSGAKDLIVRRRPRLLLELNALSTRASGKQPADVIRLLLALGFAHFAELTELSTFRSLERMEFNPIRNVLVR